MKLTHDMHRAKMLATAVMLLAMGLLTAACHSKSLTDEVHTLTNNVWNRFTPEAFEVVPAHKGDYFNIDVSTSVDTTLYRYSSLPLTVKIYGPSGEHRMFYAEIPLKENGRWQGEVKEGYREVRHRIRTYFCFNAEGQHRIDIGQATSQYDLEGVHSIGLHIDRTKLDYTMD